jgi:hypothetical protein
MQELRTKSEETRMTNNNEQIRGTNEQRQKKTKKINSIPSVW